MKRTLLGAAAVVAAIAAGVVVWQTIGADRSNAPALALEAGATADYAVGSRVIVSGPDSDPGADTPNAWFETHGIMRYRLEDFGDSRQLHITPLTLLGRNQEEALFSNELGIRYTEDALAQVIQDGFDMPIGANGQPVLDDYRGPAITELADQLDAPAGDPLIDQLVVPTLPVSLPAESGAARTIERYRGLSNIRFTVERVEDDALWLRAESTETTQVIAATDMPVVDTRLLGRMRINRDNGWLESITLVRRDTVKRDGKQVTIDHITRARRLPNLIVGDYAGLLDVFWDMRNGRRHEIKLRQSTADTLRAEPAPDDLELEDRETALTVTWGRLNLHIRVDDDKTELRSSAPALTELTLLDDAGQPLDLPVVLESTFPAFDNEEFADGRMFSFIALDGSEQAFDRVASARATLTYRQRESHHFTLTLDDQRRERSHGTARVIAEPDAETENVWWLQFEDDGDADYYSSYAHAAPGVRAESGAAPRHGWLTADEAQLMARVDAPGARVQTVRVSADRSPVEYPLVRSVPVASHEYKVTFERRASP